MMAMMMMMFSRIGHLTVYKKMETRLTLGVGLVKVGAVRKGSLGRWVVEWGEDY